PEVIGVEAGHHDAFAAVGEVHAGGRQIVVEKLRLVYADHGRVVEHLAQQLGGAANLHRLDAHLAVRDNLVGRKAIVEHRFEDLHLLPRNLRAAQAADQLFALSAEHAAGDHFDPAVGGGTERYIHIRAR